MCFVISSVSHELRVRERTLRRETVCFSVTWVTLVRKDASPLFDTERKSLVMTEGKYSRRNIEGSFSLVIKNIFFSSFVFSFCLDFFFFKLNKTTLLVKEIILSDGRSDLAYNIWPCWLIKEEVFLALNDLQSEWWKYKLEFKLLKETQILENKNEEGNEIEKNR